MPTATPMQGLPGHSMLINLIVRLHASGGLGLTELGWMSYTQDIR